MTPPKQLREIATRCRAACEWYVAHHNDIDCGNARTLKAFCLIAATFVTSKLQHGGFPCRTVVNARETHAWTVYGNWAVDITLTQFGGPRVSVWRSRVREYPVVPAHWPKGQRPTVARLKKLHSIY